MSQKSKQKKEEKSTDDDDDDAAKEDIAEGGDSDGGDSDQPASSRWSVRSIAFVAAIAMAVVGAAFVVLQIHYRANYKSVPHIIFHDLLAGANGLIDATRVNQKSKIDGIDRTF